MDGTNLTIIDFADPAQPTLRSKHPADGAKVVEVGNGMAYVATPSRVQVIDVLDASKPTLKGLYKDGNASNADVTALRLVNNTLFLSRGFWAEGSTNCIDAIDVADPANPVRVGRYTVSESVHLTGPLEASEDRLPIAWVNERQPSIPKGSHSEPADPQSGGQWSG